MFKSLKRGKRGKIRRKRHEHASISNLIMNRGKELHWRKRTRSLTSAIQKESTYDEEREKSLKCPKKE